MDNFSKLNDSIDMFFKTASFENERQYLFYFTSIMSRISNLIQGGIASTKNSISNSKHQDFQNLLISFNACSKISKSCTPNSLSSLSDLENLLGGMSFVTTTSNAGTGYNALTAKQVGDMKPPKYYVDVTSTLVKQLKEKVFFS